MSIFNQQMIRQIINDHHQNPRNKGEVTDSNYQQKHLHSSSCIDDFKLQVLVKDGIVVDFKFMGIGCAISTASTSILSTLVIGKTITEVKQIISEYLKMIYNKPYSPDMLEEANALANVYRQPSRIKCATITWNGLLEIIGADDEPV